MSSFGPSEKYQDLFVESKVDCFEGKCGIEIGGEWESFIQKHNLSFFVTKEYNASRGLRM